MVHTGVPDWPKYTQRADIVVAAAGVPGILQPEHLTPGVVVVGGGVRYEGEAAARRRRALRGGRRLDHPASGWGRADDHRHALPQCGRVRGAASGGGEVNGVFFLRERGATMRAERRAGVVR